MKTKALFELEMEDDDYQWILNCIEHNGFYQLPDIFKGITIRKIGIE